MADSDDKTAGTNEVSDADIIAALGLDEKLQPTTQKVPEEPQETDETGEGEPAEPEDSGQEEQAGEEEPDQEQDTGEETEEEEVTAEADEQPRGIKAMQKRIDKITAVRKELEEENRTLKERLGSAQPIKLNPSADDPLSDLNTEQELEERGTQMAALTRWCYENLDGGEVEVQGGKIIELTSKEVRQRLATAEEILRDHIPKRRQFLKDRSGWDSVAKIAYPALWDEKSEESKMANAFLRLCPSIMRVPSYQIIIGDAIEGMRLRMAKEAAKKSPKKEQIAPRATKPSQPPLKVASKANGTPRLARRFEQTGSVSDLAALIEATL